MTNIAEIERQASYHLGDAQLLALRTALRTPGVVASWLPPDTLTIRFQLSSQSTSCASLVEAGSTATDIGNYCLIRREDHWLARFEGRPLTLRHYLGLGHISCLLARPNTYIDSLEMVRVATSNAPLPVAAEFEKISNDQLAAQGLHRENPAHSEEVLDHTAVRSYKIRIREIPEELAEAKRNNDTKLAEQLENEWDFLMEDLKSLRGLGGRRRKAPVASDRARIAVKKSITRAIRHVNKYDEPFAAFLSKSIRTGETCIYAPDRLIPWNLG